MENPMSDVLTDLEDMIDEERTEPCSPVAIAREAIAEIKRLRTRVAELEKDVIPGVVKKIDIEPGCSAPFPYCDECGNGLGDLHHFQCSKRK